MMVEYVIARLMNLRCNGKSQQAAQLAFRDLVPRWGL